MAALLTSGALATTCAWQPFAAASKAAPLIVEARVLRYGGTSGDPPTPDYMDVQVLNTLKGRAPTKELRVYGDNGGSGRRFVSGYPVGTTWMLALTRDFDHWPVKDRRPQVYAFPSCADPGLAVIGDTVFGTLGEPFNSSRPRQFFLQELQYVWKHPLGR
ncbi:hypothetical protein GCM10017781_40830 [Deinococcus metalli]|uniref:Uncharacterized protein n=1 Tax=Deinococcus metalli TaxID=1141878 RepID=A0ABQ3JSX2_9DEIO|nr:hypothetical protein GCM10017781_40830 [Deinococcus metalli]